jgi:hypothetical protein
MKRSMTGFSVWEVGLRAGVDWLKKQGKMMTGVHMARNADQVNLYL